MIVTKFGGEVRPRNAPPVAVVATKSSSVPPILRVLASGTVFLPSQRVQLEPPAPTTPAGEHGENREEGDPLHGG